MCLMLLSGTLKCGQDVTPPLALSVCLCLMFVYEKVQVCVTGERRSTSLRRHSLKHQPSYLFDFLVICIFDLTFYWFFFPLLKFITCVHVRAEARTVPLIFGT